MSRHGQPGARHNACDMAITPYDRAGGHGHDMAAAAHDTAMRARLGAPVRACANLGVLAGSAGCAHCALVQFLDSVLFLSHCLDTVHHKIFSKKN